MMLSRWKLQKNHIQIYSIGIGVIALENIILCVELTMMMYKRKKKIMFKEKFCVA